MNSNTKGNITELSIMLEAIKAGFTVSIPYGNCDKYDQLWDINGHLFRVQIKTARQTSKYNNLRFNCYSVSNGKKHRYTADEVDYFATIWKDVVYVVPVTQCSQEKTLWLDVPKELETQRHKLALASDYTLTSLIEKIN